MKLKEILKKSGITYSQAAKVLNIDKFLFCHMANYKCLPTPEQLKKLCNFLNCNINEIYETQELAVATPQIDTKNIFNNKLHNTTPLNDKLNRCNSLKNEKGG